MVVVHSNGEFRFRCYGAKKVAANFTKYLSEGSPIILFEPARHDIAGTFNVPGPCGSPPALGDKTKMLLADYSSQNHYFEFDPDTGRYSRIRLSASRKDCISYSGNAQLLRSFREGKVLVAQFVSSGDAWLSIGPEKWKLFDESIAVKHDEIWCVFLCELSLHKDGKCIRKFRYFRRDWFLAIIDSTYDQLDFSLANLPVDMVPHDLSPLQQQREDFIKLWPGNPASNRAPDSDAPK